MTCVGLFCLIPHLAPILIHTPCFLVLGALCLVNSPLGQSSSNTTEIFHSIHLTYGKFGHLVLILGKYLLHC